MLYTRYTQEVVSLKGETMAPRQRGTRLSKNQKTLPSKAWIRSPNGQGRVKIGARIPVEELEALEAMAEGFEISLSEAVRQAVREKLTEEKLLVS